MSQSDLFVDNQTAPAFRSDLNNALQALATLSSGATAPSTTYANMLWYDTANNILKMRSENDDAWINVGYLDQSANAFRILDDTQVVNTSGTQTGLLGDQTEATWETGTSTTESLVSPAKVKAAIEALAPIVSDYQQFTSNGTWTKPSGIDADAQVMIEAWGGGGGGGSAGGGGGGGGGYTQGIFRAGDLPSSLTITVGNGGGVSANGQNTTVGSIITALGGLEDPVNESGGGGGGAGGVNVSGTIWSGGKGGSSEPTRTDGSDAVYGGAGGGGQGQNGGTSAFGGNGGASGVNGSAPGGGGGSGASGARGEVIIRVL